MTIKEASVKFGIEEKEIRTRKKDNMIIGVYKDGKSVVIPDETMLIPSKKQIQSFLLQIVKYKNNNSFSISRALCPQEDQLNALMNYLYERGFIGEYTFTKDIKRLFDNIQITDDGFDFVFGHCCFNKLSSIDSIPIQLNPSINLSVIKVG